MELIDPKFTWFAISVVFFAVGYVVGAVIQMSELADDDLDLIATYQGYQLAESELMVEVLQAWLDTLTPEQQDALDRFDARSYVVADELRDQHADVEFVEHLDGHALSAPKSGMQA